MNKYICFNMIKVLPTTQIDCDAQSPTFCKV